MRTQTQPFFRGVPTQIDVDKLNDFFGVPEVGNLIEWDQIEQILEIEKTERRFRTVVRRWRDLLYATNNIVLDAEMGKGVRVCTPTQRLKVSGNMCNLAIKRINRASDIAAQTSEDGLSDAEKSARRHLAGIGGRLALVAATTRKELE